MTRSPAPIPPRGLSREDAATYAGIGASLFDRAVRDGLLPGPMRLYGRKVWDRQALDRALDRLSDGGAPEAQPAPPAPDEQTEQDRWAAG